MPSSFGQYQSGIEAATGNLVPAYSKMAELTASSIAGFGQNLSAGIQKYQANSQENEMIDQEAQGLGMQLKQFHDMFGSNPEYAPFAEQLNPYIEKLAKIPEMSLAQKRGALNGAKIAFSNIGQNLNMYDKFMQMEKVSAMQKALETPIETNLKGESLKYSAPLYVKEGLSKFSISKDYASQERDFVNYIYKQNKDNPRNTIDITQALSSYRQSVKDAANELSKTNPIGNIISEQVDAQIARRSKEGLSPAEQMAYGKTVNVSAEELAKARGTTNTPTVLQGDLNKYLTTTDSKGNIIPNESYRNLQKNLSGNPLNVQNKNRYLFERKLEQDAKSLGIWDEKERLKAQKLDNALEKGEFEAGKVRPNENAYYQNILNKVNEVKNSKQIELRKSLLEDKDVQSKIAEYAKGNFDEIGLPSKALELANKLGFDRTDYGFNMNARTLAESLPLGIGAVAIPMQYGEVQEKLPPALVDFFSRIKEGKINKETATVDVGKPNIADNQQQQINRSKPIWEQTQSELKNNPVSEKITNIENKEPDKLKLSKINIGSQEQYKQLQQAEKTQILKQTYAKILGKKDANGNYIVPYDFEQTMKFFAPSEPVIRNVAGVGMMIQQPDGKWEQLKGGGFQDVRKEGMGVFGKVDPNTGELEEQEVGIKGSGIMVSGIYKGSDASLDKFYDDMGAFSDARRGLRRALEVNAMTGESLNPSLRGEMAVEVSMIISGLRKDVVGGGQVSDYENKLLQTIVKEPTAIFSLESADKAALQAILARTERKILAYGNGRGLNVRLSDMGLTPTQFARDTVRGL